MSSKNFGETTRTTRLPGAGTSPDRNAVCRSARPRVGSFFHHRTHDRSSGCRKRICPRSVEHTRVDPRTLRGRREAPTEGGRRVQRKVGRRIRERRQSQFSQRRNIRNGEPGTATLPMSRSRVRRSASKQEASRQSAPYSSCSVSITSISPTASTTRQPST